MIPKIQKILYTTDLSPNSAYVFRYAMNSAVKHNANLIILHVFEHISTANRGLLEVHIDEEQWTKMSLACCEWYQRNVHSKNCWKNMIEHILYK